MSDSKYTLKKNKKFGFFQVDPTPSEEEISSYYADEFYSTKYKQLNNSGLLEQTKDKGFYDAHRNHILSLIKKYNETKIEDMDILDVGCGFGETLAFLKEQGANTFGFDPAIDAVKYAQKNSLNIVQAGMQTVDVFNGQKFDVVSLFNVLEHLSDPEAVINEIREKIISPEGLVIIEVPNEFNAFQQCGQKVHGLEEWWVAPPAHLNYFNKDSLCKLLSHCGFNVLHAEGSFPMEMFLLFDENYVDDRTVGRKCHEKRMAFERHLREQGHEDALNDFYQALASVNLGRQVLVVAVSN